MEFITDGHNDQKLKVTGNDYRHMLQPQTSATPSNISEQTTATDTTIGSDVNLLSNKTSLSIDQVCFFLYKLSAELQQNPSLIDKKPLFIFNIQNGVEIPTTDIPDIDDVGVEEITMNSADSFHNRTTVKDLNLHRGTENHVNSKKVTNNHTRAGDVEATLNEGKHFKQQLKGENSYISRFKVNGKY